MELLNERYKKYVFDKIESEKKIINNFNALNDEQIIEYDKIIRKHPEVMEHHRKIKAMDRTTVFADLKAAREWVAKKPAQAARDRMAAI